MEGQDRRFSGYDFARNKGYPTRRHLEALHRLGPCDLHRRSFAPVRDLVTARGAPAYR
jgi:ribonuclease HII